jgi:hypothetical protein
MIQRNLPTRILLTALLLGWAADLLFYRAALGISLLLFATLALSLLFLLGRSKSIRPARANLWLLLPLTFCATMAFIRANPFLTFLNVAATFALLGLIAHFYTGGRVASLGLVGYPAVLTRVGLNTLVQAAPLVPAAVDLPAARRQGELHFFPILRGSLLALPVLGVFTLLLASADLVFAAYVRAFFQLTFLSSGLNLSWRFTLILAIAWLAAGTLAYSLLHEERAETRWERLGRFSHPLNLLGFTEAITLLALIDLLFLAFVAVQFAYLFGGLTNITVEGYNYAQYARRGFFELVAVACMTLCLVLSLHSLAGRNTPHHRRLFNALSSLMVALVLIMLVSAFKRLRLYEAAFGFTELRLYVHTFMVWLGLLFAWFLLTLWRRPDHFAIGAFLAALGFLATLNLLNPDAYITRQNITRFLQNDQAILQPDSLFGPATANSRIAGPPLDTHYLATLSYDAVPTLVPALHQLPPSERAAVCQALETHLTTLSAPQYQPWPAFHLSRLRAHHALHYTRWQSQC